MGVSYNGAIVRSGLVLHLDAANPRSYPGSGTTWTDLSGNGNNGTLTNGPTYSNGSIIFDGTNDYVNFGNILNFNYTDSFSLCAFFKRNSTGAGVDNILSKQSMSNPYEGYQFGFNLPSAGSDGKLGIVAIGKYPNHAMGIETVATYNDNNWYHAIATYNGNGSYTGMNLWVNGILQTTTWFYIGTNSITFYNSANFEVGARDGSQQAIAANIPVVQVYNRALSASEVQQNFNALRGRFGI